MKRAGRRPINSRKGTTAVLSSDRTITDGRVDPDVPQKRSVHLSIGDEQAQRTEALP